MDITEANIPWVTNRDKCDELFSEVFEKARQLEFADELCVLIPDELLSTVVTLTGEALSFLNGKKWGYHVVTALTLRESMGFTELSSFIDGVSNRALSTRLKECVEMGLVTRKVDPGPPMRTSYSLTQHGRSVATLLTPLVYYMKREMGFLELEQFTSK